MFRKIIYAVLMLISLIFYVMFQGDLSLYTLISVAAFPLAMLLVLLTGRHFIDCGITPAARGAVKKNGCEQIIEIKNSSILPFPNAEIEISYQNLLSNETEHLFILVPINALHEQRVRFPLSSEYCGILSVRLESVRIHDYMKLFSLRKKIKKDSQTIIFPGLYNTDESTETNRIPDTDSDIFSKQKSGDDPSEIFELKDYVPGDRMSRIHWNLSSRQSSLITKHYSLGVSSPVLMVPDIDLSDDIANTDAALELFFGTAYRLMSAGTVFRVLMPDVNDAERVTDFDTLRQIYERLLTKEKTLLNDKDTAAALTAASSKVYFFTNTDEKDYHIFDECAQTQQIYLFVSGDAADITERQSEGISIIKLPPEAAMTILEEKML